MGLSDVGVIGELFFFEEGGGRALLLTFRMWCLMGFIGDSARQVSNVGVAITMMSLVFSGFSNGVVYVCIVVGICVGGSWMVSVFDG